MFEMEINGNVNHDVMGAGWDGLESIEVRPSLIKDYVCKECNRYLEDYGTGEYSADEGGAWDTTCPKNPIDGTDDFGPHVAVPVALSWLSAARIEIEKGRDQANVMLTLDSETTLTLSVHRVNDPEHENHGKLVLIMPYVGAPGQADMRQIANGGFVIG